MVCTCLDREQEHKRMFELFRLSCVPVEKRSHEERLWLRNERGRTWHNSKTHAHECGRLPRNRCTEISYQPLWHVYVLIDPLTYVVRYIGVTTQTLEKRLNEHTRNKELRAWIQSLNNNLPLIEEIDIIRGDRQTAEALEERYVLHYLAMGYELLNIKHAGGNRELLSEHMRGYEQRKYRYMKVTL